MDSPPQMPGQDPFLSASMRDSQYDSSSSSAFNSTLQQPTTNEFGDKPQLSSNTQEQSRSETSQPFSTQPPPRHRMPQSQYYIVFSVTGIERSNVKNPIIRFDAKVSFPSIQNPIPFFLTVTCRPIFLAFVHPSCVT